MKSTVTAPNNDVSYSYTNGAGQTSKTERVEPGTNEPVVIEYAFDPIGQLLTVTDAGNNVTSYAYDLAGRRLSVNHPSAGLTSFVYDNAGNVLRRGTANGDTVTYQYEYNRLVKTEYPRHPENNVTYTYGGRNAKHNRVGRLALVEDGSGATEYYYGKMGEVTKQRRTLIIPNVAVATYTTEWTYDSHNRLMEMIYPDGEKIKYFYNLGGQLSSIVGEKKYLYRYIDTIGYDMYEQRKYMKYGNGVETNYAYSPNRRRLESLTVASKGVNIMDNTYTYDVMDNIVRLVNNGVTQVGKDGKTIGGYTSHSYSYDKWNRLTNAMGSFRPNATDSAHYNLAMTYDKLYNVTSKKLDLIQENLQFAGRLETGHEFTYHYDKENPFKLLNVSTKEYTSDSAVVDTFMRIHHYNFDANGNQTMVAMNPVVDSTCVVDTAGTKVRQLLWDEDNHLLSINDNGFVSNYFYDVNGERTVKLSAPDLSVFVNGTEALNNDSTLMKFVGYVSPYLVVSNGGRYTKHIYAGTQRIASKMGGIESFGEDPRRVQTAGAGIKEIDFGGKYDMQNAALFARYDSFNVDNKPKENSDYVGGQSFCCGKAKGEYSNNNSKNSENAQFEGDIRFYHPDHLGSTTVVTDLDGEVTQNVAYIPYGEVFVEQRNGTWNTPYLFNAKELDEETGLYYYGARYLDPTGTRWLSVDPLFEKYVGMSPYNYCAGNPVKLVDPNGEDIYVFDEDGNFSHKIAQEGEHIGRYQSGDVTVDFKFADPINDPKAIDGESFDEYGNQIIINRIEVKSVTEIDNALWNSGVYNKENQDNKWSFAMNEADASDISKGNGRMDYVVTANFERGKEQKVLNDVGEVADIDSHTLYITKTKSGYYAHNDHNFGNFLWGAGMKALGFNESTAKLGADIFAIRKHGELDSKDDQLSIKLGYEWGKK